MPPTRAPRRRPVRALPPGSAVLAALAVLAVQAVGAGPARADGPAALVDGGGYVLGSVLDGGCLGPQYAQSAAGTPVVGAACQGLLSQRWQLHRTTDGYRLVNAASGRCLTLDGTGRHPGTADCGTDPAAETFAISPAPGGSHTLAAHGACLTTAGDRRQNSAADREQDGAAEREQSSAADH
ncbi:RICIN domain-containing protein, partial [Kitasatospora sp. NPDC059817]|uniref:RICIN domain-containing protein n=1 Tax=Kitasatospora sp. NPDC059817 TaxID=3346961 RepID=UPI00365BCF4A